jgi:hypothetical protein
LIDFNDNHLHHCQEEDKPAKSIQHREFSIRFYRSGMIILCTSALPTGSQGGIKNEQAQAFVVQYLPRSNICGVGIASISGGASG